MKYLNLKNILTAALLSCLLQTPVLAGDLSFDSFEAAEAAAKKRADEYQKRMEEHIKSVNEQWEKQQKDLGSDASSPDITKITTSSDGQKSSDTDASKSMEDAVNSSVNKLKDEMISKAGPNSTGFAGGAAGYQWSVKFKNGKYVLSDSYNEAEFNTGKKKEDTAATPGKEPAKEAGGDDQETAPVETAETPAETPDKTVSEAAPVEPVKTAATTPASKNEPAESKPATSENGKPAETGKPAEPAKIEEPAKPAAGVDPAPVKLPPPSVRMVIQHPTDFSEEVFAGNATSESTANYRLDKFKIPEDTRIKISVEVGDDVRPEDVSMVVTDDQGDSAPVSEARLKNYRHMFRVPSDDQYSASVYVTDSKTPGKQQKKILQVMIPVSKVDFESRTLDNQKGSKSGSNMALSDTSSSASSESSSKSGFGQPQQVDLSDLYSSPDSLSSGQSGSSGSSGSSESIGSSDSSGAGDSSLSGNSSGSEDSSNGSLQPGSGDDAASSHGNGGSANDSSSASDSGSSATDQHSATSANSDSSSDNAASDSGTSQESNSDGTSLSNGDATSEGSNDEGSSESTGDLTGGDSAASADGSSGSGDSSSSSGDNRQSSTGNGDGGDSDSSGIASTAEGQNVDMNQTADSAAAQSATGNGDESRLAANSSDRKQPGTGQNGQPAQNEEDPFILALSLKAEAQKVYQSFDFIDGNTQTSADIKAGGEVAFSLSFGSQVEPDSIQIKVSDGSQELKGNLKRMGESFVYVFPTPTQNAFIEVSGKTEKRSFNYRVGIPVR